MLAARGLERQSPNQGTAGHHRREAVSARAHGKASPIIGVASAIPSASLEAAEAASWLAAPDEAAVDEADEAELAEPPQAAKDRAMAAVSIIETAFFHFLMVCSSLHPLRFPPVSFYHYAVVK